MTSNGTIDYEGLTREAMRGVVQTILRQVEANGLPGEHHFFIEFNTLAAGVVLSKRLREQYPRQMTIVLQHRFWDLQVRDDAFEVKLTFDGIPERLVVPFKAIRVFFDPSVRYALPFEAPEMEQREEFENDPGDNSSAGGLTLSTSAGGRSLKPVAPLPIARVERQLSEVSDGDRPTRSDVREFEDSLVDVDGLDAPAELEDDPEVAAASSSDEADTEELEPSEAEKGVVVSLDQFRKK